MGWLFFFAVLFLMVFLVLNSYRTRLVALGVLGIIAAAIAFYFYFIDVDEHKPVPTVVEEKLEDTRQLAEKTALARQAIRPQDIAIEDQSFAPAVEEYRDSAGKLQQRRDLFSWTFSGKLKNLNSDYAIRDVSFRIRLFACPDFLTGQLDLAALEVRCNTIGDRRFGLYGRNVAPGAAAEFSEPVTFDNQPNPGNWRVWIDTLSVTANID